MMLFLLEYTGSSMEVRFEVPSVVADTGNTAWSAFGSPVLDLKLMVATR